MNFAVFWNSVIITINQSTLCGLVFIIIFKQIHGCASIFHFLRDYYSCVSSSIKATNYKQRSSFSTDEGTNPIHLHRKVITN